MQRLLPGERGGYAARKLILRDRKRHGQRGLRPATTPRASLYLVRMRNTPHWGEYVRQLRKATGISRPELARRLGINPSSVWRWEERGARPESPDVPEALANLFHLDLDDVLAAAGLRPRAEAPEPTVEVDDEVQLVLDDDDLPPRMKTRIIGMIHERREREKQAAIEETRNVINLFKRGA